MWKALQQGWVPEINYTKEQYKYYKDNKDLDLKLTGYLGFNCSYSGKWFAGFAGITKTKVGIRNYQIEAHRNVTKQVPFIQDVVFKHSSYDTLEIPDESIIYCDPPYQNTTKYQSGINHEHFWNWCRDMSIMGHEVFISEYSAPKDFTCVWSKELNSSLSANGKTGTNKKSIEKLFTYL